LFSKIREVLFKEDYKTGFAPHYGGMRLDGIHILMAEDNELNTEIAVELLTSSGILLDCAVNGKEALEMFEASEPSSYAVILMDMQMPVMTGCEATAAIRKSNHPDASKIPIIAMTANAFEEDIREALKAGMNAHVAKPINFETLKTVVSSFLPDIAEEYLKPVSPGLSGEPAKTEPVFAVPGADLNTEKLTLHGINVQAGIKRLGGNKKAYEKILLKFPSDNSFEQLSEAMLSGDFESAVKAAHALKGVAANLSIEGLAEELSRLEKALKQGDNALAVEVFGQVGSVYEKVTEVLING
jgi:CheY-like chemotaxis protein